MSNLTQEIKERRLELLKLSEEWQYLKKSVEPQMYKKYSGFFWKLESELKELNSNEFELDKILRIVKIRLEKRLPLNSKILGMIKDEAREECKNKELLETANKEIGELAGFRQIELKLMYKSLIKAVHPDLNNQNNQSIQYWHNVREAYLSGNFKRMRMYHQKLSRQSLYNDMKDLRSLEKEIISYRKKIREFKERPEYIFLNRLENSRWIENRRKLLQFRIYVTGLRVERKKEDLSRLLNCQTKIFKLLAN